MASLTIRNLDDDLKRRLRVRAAEHGRSMEAEARQILRETLDGPRGARPDNLAQAIHACFADLGGVELQLPSRKSTRRPPDFTK